MYSTLLYWQILIYREMQTVDYIAEGGGGRGRKGRKGSRGKEGRKEGRKEKRKKGRKERGEMEDFEYIDVIKKPEDEREYKDSKEWGEGC